MTTISELLRGCTVGHLQSVGHMTIIPLLSDVVDDGFVSPLQGGLVSTRSYGTLSFRNPTDDTMIIPSHIGYLTKQKAQDHAMTKAGFVRSKTSKEYNDAACVESTQSGYMEEKHEKRTLILPLLIREFASKVRKQKSYRKLWNKIVATNKSYGVNDSGGHLKMFFDTFEKQLEQFVAEFEYVPKQVGAIVLIDGKVTGLDRAPNYKFWESIWALVIRDCYGSEAIKFSKDKPKAKPSMRVPLRPANSLDELAKNLADVAQEEYDLAAEVVNGLSKAEFTIDKDESSGSLIAETISNEQLVGQVVRQDGRPIYTSLITKGQYKKHGTWYGATKFAM